MLGVRARSTLLALALAIACSTPAGAHAQFGGVISSNAFQRMGAVLLMIAGVGGFLGTWLAFPLHVQDRHFDPCRDSCNAELGAAFVPLVGPWVVLGSSVMVPEEESIAFGVAQLGSLALAALGVVLWITSEDPNDGPYVGLSPLLDPSGGAGLALVGRH